MDNEGVPTSSVASIQSWKTTGSPIPRQLWGEIIRISPEDKTSAEAEHTEFLLVFFRWWLHRKIKFPAAFSYLNTILRPSEKKGLLEDVAIAIKSTDWHFL